jgi:hypothetical protein
MDPPTPCERRPWGKRRTPSAVAVATTVVDVDVDAEADGSRVEVACIDHPSYPDGPALRRLPVGRSGRRLPARVCNGPVHGAYLGAATLPESPELKEQRCNDRTPPSR